MNALTFRTPAEIRASAPPEPDWVLNGYAAGGCITAQAAPPKHGKTTLALAAADAVASEALSFLGRAINGGPVVIVSEETTVTLLHKLPISERVSILTREAAWPKPPWPELLAAAVEEAVRIDARLLIIDTLPYWAGMAADKEKDAGAALAVMAPALEAVQQHPHLALLLELHTRKGGGSDGEALRGSNAFTGAVDIVLEIERTTNPHQRAILALSRFPATPGTLLYDHDPHTGTWRVVAEGVDRGDARDLGDRQALLDALADGQPRKRAELEQSVGAPEIQWHAVMHELVESGTVRQTGEGKKGDPYRFELVRTDAAQAAAQKGAASVVESSSDSAALYVVEQQKRNDPAPSHIPRNAQKADDLANRVKAINALPDDEQDAAWALLDAEQHQDPDAWDGWSDDDLEAIGATIEEAA
jgi:hypothetical protein